LDLGPVMLDLAGTELTAEERELLAHPAVGGVILFARNCCDPQQLGELTLAIHALREPPLLVAVDQEGGRVQRCQTGFVRLPPAARFGRLRRVDPNRAREAAERIGWLTAAELRARGVDFSFAPVLDLDRGVSRVIGERAFAGRPEMVAGLAAAWARGARAAGMAAVGKHFPGHGGVAADSHTELPRDERPLDALQSEDLVPFARLIGQGLEAVMPAHVVYPLADALPAGFSPYWLRGVLRGDLAFQGLIISDDLSMGAVAAQGGPRERAELAREAGCDMVLVCNDRRAAEETVVGLTLGADPAVGQRQGPMRGRYTVTRSELEANPRWQQALRVVAELEELGEEPFNVGET